MAIVFALRLHALPPQIPLFYSLPPGEDQLVEWWMIFMIPLLMDILLIVHGIVSHFIPSQELFIRKTLHITTITLVILCTFLFVRIIMLVT